MSLTLRTSKAIGWTTAARIIQQVFQFCLSVVLMRLLGPKAFGLIGMVLVFSGFVAIFRELGFSSALVQYQNLREEHRSTIFWLTLLMGGVLTLILLLAAPLIAAFYKEPMLKPMTAWLAFSFLLSAPGMVPAALLQKSMRFDILAKTNVVALILSGTAAAIMAFKGAGVWSLVAQQLITAAVASTILFLFVDWKPKFQWSRYGLRELLGYGAGLTGFNIVNYWARSADKLLIGKFMDATALGLYSRAYSLMLLPLTQVVSVISPVMFPALSSIQGDKPRVRNAYLRAMRLLTFITFPMMLGLAVVAKPFVLALFGKQWAGIIPLIQILSFVGMTQTLCNPTGWIYMSQGRTDWFFWWGLGGSGFLVASIVVGVLFGRVEMVAWAYLIGNLIITIPCIAIPGRLINMTFRDVWVRVRGNLFCAGSMAIIVWSTAQALPQGLKPWFQLLIQIAVGAAVYVATGWFFTKSVYIEIWNFVSSMITRSSTQSIGRNADVSNA